MSVNECEEDVTRPDDTLYMAGAPFYTLNGALFTFRIGFYFIFYFLYVFKN